LEIEVGSLKGEVWCRRLEFQAKDRVWSRRL